MHLPVQRFKTRQEISYATAVSPLLPSQPQQIEHSLNLKLSDQIEDIKATVLASS